MEVSRENLAGNKVKLTITLDAGEWSALLDKAAEQLSAQVKIEGFRPGKAPRSVVAGKVGEGSLLSAAIEEAVQKYYPEAARKEELRPVSFPAISVDKGSLEEPLVFTAEVGVMPEIKLGDYKSIRVKKVVPEVTEEMVTETLEGLRKKAAEYVEVERPVQEGDWTEIDFTGSVDGKEFPGGSSKNHPLVIGEKMFIPGFEEGLVGMKAGENKNIEVTFPAEYHAKELAGKKATFAVQLHMVKAVNYPEMDDDFAAKVSQYKTLEELRADIRKFMEEDANRKAEDKVREEAIKELVKMAEMELPDELVDNELAAMVDDLKRQITHGQMSFEEYLKKAGTDEAGLKAEWREQATQRVKAGLALDALRKAENIEVTHDDIHAEIERLKQLYPDQVEEIEQHYGNHNHGSLESQMVTRKAVDRLTEIATQ